LIHEIFGSIIVANVFGLLHVFQSSSSYLFISIKVDKTQLYNGDNMKNEKVTNLRELMLIINSGVGVLQFFMHS